MFIDFMLVMHVYELGCSGFLWSCSWRGILISILCLGVLEELLGLLSLFLRLGVLCQLLLDGVVAEVALLRDSEPIFGAFASQAPLEPSSNVGKQAINIDTAQHGDIGPAEDGDVGDRVAPLALAGQVLAAVAEARVEDAVEALGFAYVALDAVGDFLFGEAEEVVCLALPVGVVFSS